MKHPKILPSLISMAVLAAIATPAQSHVFYKKIDITKAGKQYKGEYAYPNSGGVNSLTSVANGWVVASKPRTLAQTMSPPGDANWLRFHLDKPALVNIDEIPRAAPGASAASTPKYRSTWDAANYDPAFSLYRGLVPQLAMANPNFPNDFDTVQPVAVSPPLPEDGSVMAFDFPAMSKWDAAPNDPNISITLFDLDANDVAKASSLGLPKRKNNPDWNLTISQLVADMTADPGNVVHPWRTAYLSDHLQNLLATDASTTVSEWYTNNYQPHNGYRDTLNFTTFEGGMCLEDTPGADDLNYGNGNVTMPGGGCIIGMPVPVSYGYFGYFGEVDTLGDFSLPNGWANCAIFSECAVPVPPNYDPATTTICPETNPDGSPGDCAGGNPAGVDWAKISYLGHANRHDSEGQVETPDGNNKGSSNISAEHLHGIYLTAGDYTLYVSGGCGECYDHTGGGSSIPPEYGGAMTQPSPYDTHPGGMNLSLSAWPVKECAAQQSGQQKPELSPVSGPWDVTAGTSTTVDLHAYYCGNDVPQFQTKPGFTAEIASPEAKTPNGWKSTLNWTAPTVSKAKLVTTTVTAADSNGKSKSNAQKVTMRVWPEGLSPTNSFEVKNIKASWDAKKFKFKITGKVVLKNANVLKPEEKQALFGNYLILSNGADIGLGGYGIFDIMPSAKGVISHEQPADISSIPCTLKWHYRSQQGSVPVKNAPKDCIPDAPI